MGDKGRDVEEKITITNDNNRLTPEEIEKMLQEAEQWAEQDKEQKEKIDARNELEQYSYTLKRQLDDKEQLGGKIPEQDKEKIMEIVTEQLQWLRDSEEASAEEFKEAKREIENVAQPIIEALYQNNNSSGEEDSTSNTSNDEL